MVAFVIALVFATAVLGCRGAKANAPFKRRWFILKSNLLFYFKTDSQVCGLQLNASNSASLRPSPSEVHTIPPLLSACCRAPNPKAASCWKKLWRSRRNRMGRTYFPLVRPALFGSLCMSADTLLLLLLAMYAHTGTFYCMRVAGFDCRNQRVYHLQAPSAEEKVCP